MQREPHAAARLRLGIVGCGAVVCGRHLPALARVPGIEVLAVADVEPRALEEAATRFGIPRRYATAQSLAADPDVEAVAVCTPPATHLEAALAALDAGKHLFVEKPLAVSLDDADRLLERAAVSSQAAVIGFNLRRHRLVRQARGLVREGALGRAHTLVSTFTDPLVRRELAPWRSRRGEGGGAVFDRAVHHFDLWRFLLDDEVAEVSATGRARLRDDDGAVVTARMRGGAIATAVVLDDTVVRHRLTIYGTEGAVEIDALRFDGLTRMALEEYPGAPRARLRRLRQRLADPRGSLAAIRRGGDFDAAYEHQWRHFADVVRRGAAPDATLADGRAALAIAVAAARSIDSSATERM
jgi:myo-inositol 2-dehydrogenase/D-chiro-inositol 1-dehydrogenase